MSRSSSTGVRRALKPAAKTRKTSSSALLFERACRAILAGGFERAARDFEAFGRISPGAFGRLGSLESPSPAEHPELFEKLAAFLREHPRCAWGRVFEAFALRALPRYPESVAAMERAAALEPGSPVLLALLARMRFVHRYPAEGVRDLERAAALAPRCGWLRAWLGEARRHQGDHARALTALDEGLRLDPWYAQAYTWRAAVKDALGRPAAALADLDEAIRRDRRAAWAYHQRMRLRRAAGDARGALADARTAHRLNPKFGWISGRPGDEAAARAALADADAVLAGLPGSSWAWAYLPSRRSASFRPESASR
jgi:tetratricopeptide (TPR) repeat protein